VDSARCFDCLLPGQLELVKVLLLCRILQTNNPQMTCDPQTLLAAANCFNCLSPYQLQLVQTQLFCEILHSGGGGQSCLYCSTGPPNFVPACDCALYLDKTVKTAISLWAWYSDTAEWEELIA